MLLWVPKANGKLLLATIICSYKNLHGVLTEHVDKTVIEKDHLNKHEIIITIIMHIELSS